VHRVVTKWIDHRGKWIEDQGPWLSSLDDAEGWADRFRRMGYQVKVQSISGNIQGGGDDFALSDALAGMA